MRKISEKEMKRAIANKQVKSAIIFYQSIKHYDSEGPFFFTFLFVKVETMLFPVAKKNFSNPVSREIN